MLKKRIITTMLWNGETLVKGNQFINSRRAGSAITKNVKKKTLALTRSLQTEIKNYKRKFKQLCVE